MKDELIEKIEALPKDWDIYNDNRTHLGLTTDDLKSLAARARAGEKLAGAAKRYLHLEGVDVFSSECNDAEAELRAALAECDKILGGGK